MHRYTVAGGDDQRECFSLAAAKQYWAPFDAFKTSNAEQTAKALREHTEPVVDLISAPLRRALDAAR